MFGLWKGKVELKVLERWGEKGGKMKREGEEKKTQLEFMLIDLCFSCVGLFGLKICHNKLVTK